MVDIRKLKVIILADENPTNTLKVNDHVFTKDEAIELSKNLLECAYPVSYTNLTLPTSDPG